MIAPDWFSKFRNLHRAAKGLPLPPADHQAYERYKDQFSSVLLSAQGLAQPPGASGRRSFRIGVLLPLELQLGGRALRTVTLDVSIGGFSTVADMAINRGDAVDFTLTLQNAEKLTGRAKVAARLLKETGARISFEFQQLSDVAAARLEVFLIDLALARIPE